MSKTLHQKFWNRIVVDEVSGCWLWTGARVRHYGQIRYGTLMLTHRLSWLLHRGPIPDGTLVLHKCDIPPCCNPDHLFLGTHSDNVQDMLAKGRCQYPFGEKTSGAVLTEAQVRQIRNDGRFQYLIAADFGVNQSTVSRIKSGKYWPHL